MVTTSDMIPLGLGLSALAFRRPSQPLDFAMELFDLPAHAVRFLSIGIYTSHISVIPAWIAGPARARSESRTQGCENRAKTDLMGE